MGKINKTMIVALMTTGTITVHVYSSTASTSIEQASPTRTYSG